MTTRIRGSDVYVVEDIERILSALTGASRRYNGEYGNGYADALRDVAAAVGARDSAPQCERIHEIVEYRHERTIERYTPPPSVPERRFAIRGEREEWPAPAQPSTMAAPANMTGDDVNITLFNTAKGRLVERDIGYGWIGNDGYTAFWNASDWQQVHADEARAMGHLVPDNWLVLMRHAYANSQRRQLAANDRRLLR